MVRITIISKCLADITPPNKLCAFPNFVVSFCWTWVVGVLIAIRTNVYNYISGFYFLASVLGSAVGSQLLYNHVYILNGLSIICYLSTACFASFVPASYGCDNPTEAVTQPSFQTELIDTSSAIFPHGPLDISYPINEVALSANPYSILSPGQS